MKRTLSLILALIMCLVLCACGGSNTNNEKVESTAAAETKVEVTSVSETEPPIETISFDDLIADTENKAKQQLNVGKKADIFGQVKTIKSDSCSVQLFHKESHRATIMLPTEVLAEMEIDQIIAVTAIVDSIQYSNYVFKADELADLSLIETYINNKISTIDEKTLDRGGSLLYSNIKSLFGMSLVYDYLEQSGTSYCTLADTELNEYLNGKWFYNYAAELGLDDETIELNNDGTLIWKFNKQTRFSWVNKEQEEEWSIDGVCLDISFDFYSGRRVYILSENAFIWSKNLYTRVK